VWNKFDIDTVHWNVKSFVFSAVEFMWVVGYSVFLWCFIVCRVYVV